MGTIKDYRNNAKHHDVIALEPNEEMYSLKS